ncbi:cysteine synthase A [Atopobiaceae bacterium 24-176]
MHIATSVSAAIGDTPLIDLSFLCNGDVTLLGKYEAANPGGSVKDRVARAMVDAAEAAGTLAEGGTIVEPTSGNTGVGLAMVAAERGYNMILVMPDTMSVERRKLAAAYGAKIELTPGATGMTGAVERAEQIVAETPGAVTMGQFVNPENPLAHYRTTGPEIWRDTDGAVDALVAGVGTGGTVSGTGRFLKEMKPSAQVFAVEPAESPILEGGQAGPHKIQGIGANFVPDNYDADVVDEVLPVKGDDAIAMKDRLAEELGLLVGISAGAAVSAAVELSEREDMAGAVIVAILPDTGERYLSLIEA